MGRVQLNLGRNNTFVSSKPQTSEVSDPLIRNLGGPCFARGHDLSAEIIAWWRLTGQDRTDTVLSFDLRGLLPRMCGHIVCSGIITM
jgi:hypothetical protein